MPTAPALRRAPDRVGWLRRNAERISGALPAPWILGSRVIRSAAAALAIIPVLALAEQPALSPGSGVTVDDAVWLFDSVCLVNHPDFRGSGAVLDGYDFSDSETAFSRQHPNKLLQAIVLPFKANAVAGARSCTVIAAGTDFADIDAKLSPLIAERLGAAERHSDAKIAVPHVVWISGADNLQTKIVLAEHEGASVIAASVAPLQEQSQ